MKLAIDGDLVAYEAACAADTVDEGMERRSFDWTIEYVDNLINRICEACEVDTPTYIFLTGKGNFRYDIATVKPYKGNRKEDKPFYLPNVRKYLEVAWGAILVDNMEADDALAITAAKDGYKDFIIASRDKDLKQVPCIHYSWEMSKQPEWGPELVDEIGELNVEFVDKILRNGEPSRQVKKISGTGLKWFYCQCITGDSTDNIPGLQGKGAVLAYELLNDAETEEDMFTRVLQAYEEKYAEDAAERLLEQGRLLWMCREKHNGVPVMWELLK
jgi:5'-3' exonuclease